MNNLFTDFMLFAENIITHYYLLNAELSILLKTQIINILRFLVKIQKREFLIFSMRFYLNLYKTLQRFKINFLFQYLKCVEWGGNKK